MNYRIGLDIGITSVGWAVLEHDENDEPIRIERMGVRTFNAAENTKDGSSCAVDRRVARGLRRRLRRRKERILKAKEYLTSVLLDGKNLDNINKDIFRLRAKALDEKIPNEDLCLIILYLIKHRGFKSNRKSETKSGESGKLLLNINNNNNYIKEKGYRTIGECIYKDSKYFSINSKGIKEYKVRNHPIGVKGSYENCFGRAELEAELIQILKSQKKLGNNKITNEFEDVIISLFNKQRSFDEGPNEPSKYKANFAVGKDIFEKEEYRAPKGSFTFEYFNALQKLNHLQIVCGGQKRKLEANEIKIVLNMLLEGKAVTYAQIRKKLNLKGLNADGEMPELFGGISYYKRETKKNEEEPTFEEIITKCEKSTFFEFKFTKAVLTKVFGDKRIDLKHQNLVDAIGLILSMRKSDNARRNAFALTDELTKRLTKQQQEALGTLNDEQIEAVIELETNKFGNLSFKSMGKIIPYLEAGNTYDKSCELAGYSFNDVYGGLKGKKIVWASLQDKLQEITSPVVLRSVSQTIKVVNAIIGCYGSPSAIFIELAREMHKNFNDRRKILKDNEKRQNENEQIIQKLKSWGITPTGQDVVKYRLYEEQQGKCAYSGKSFDKVLGGVQNIFLNNSTQIDHIIPYSKCFDDSYNNKVLVLSAENQIKGNRLPFEYMSKEQFKCFEEFVISTYANKPQKMQRLLKKSLSSEEESALNNRALNDTRHSSKFILNILKSNLEFKPSKKFCKSPVRAVNGAMTAFLRKLWGIKKERFENDRHHAIDAAIVACCTNNAINLVSRYLQFKDYRLNVKKLKQITKDGELYYIDENEKIISVDEYDKLFGPDIPKPYAHFKNELMLRASQNAGTSEAKELYQLWGYTEEQIENVKELFVSRMPTRAVKGPIHKQTLRRIKKEQGKRPVVVTRTALKDLEFKNGDIVGYSEENRKSDPLLYKALIERIKQFPKGNGYNIHEAFSQPLYKPKADGTNGPLVKKIKIESAGADFVELSNMSAAENSRRVRVDVFERNNKNYLVPIYVADVYRGVVPNKAIIGKKAREDWREMTNEYKFKFSLYPNDLIYVESIKGIKGKMAITESGVSTTKTFAYFGGVDISNGAISMTSQDRSILYGKVGVQGLKIEKYCVDVLGNVTKVGKEKRMSIGLKHK